MVLPVCVYVCGGVNGGEVEMGKGQKKGESGGGRENLLYESFKLNQGR